MFPNGRLPRAVLRPIPSGFLRRRPARAWNAMHAKIKAETGIDVRPTGSKSSYRTYDQQVELRAMWCNQGKCENAAVPGTSNHGWGLAVDVATPAMRSAIDKFGEPYGWAKKWSDASHEWWHLRYKSGVYRKLLRKERAERRRRKRAQRRRKRAARKRKAQPTQLSTKGAKFIGNFEGFVDHPYNDPVGHATIGYGHLLHRGNVTAHDRQTWGTITRERGLRLLRQDAERFEEAVRDLVKVPLNQHEFDALVSWTFNLGEGSLAESTMLKRLNANQRQAVPTEMMRWTKADGRELPGLVRRRKAEGRLFANGNYSTD